MRDYQRTSNAVDLPESCLCSAVTVLASGEHIPCTQSHTEDGLCYYHRKMDSGLTSPSDDGIRNPDELVAMVTRGDGRLVWKRPVATRRTKPTRAPEEAVTAF